MYDLFQNYVSDLNKLALDCPHFSGSRYRKSRSRDRQPERSDTEDQERTVIGLGTSITF